MVFTKEGPMPNEKVKRNRNLYRYKLRHPKITFRELGKKYKISGSAAAVIFKREAEAHGQPETKR